MTRKETDGIKLPAGMWWENVAPIGKKPDWQMRPMPDAVDPNAAPKIFGYDTRAFMARQYK